MNTVNDHVLLTITVQPNLEEPLVDWLLTQTSGLGFSSFPVDGHSSQHEGLTLSEQVSGRKRNIRFELQLDSGELPLLINSLATEFKGTGLHYWVIPVGQWGRT